jgi:steroid delta-isomerase-like uncharacterized protein
MKAPNKAPYLMALLCAMLTAAAGAAELTEAHVKAYYAAWSSGKVDTVMTCFAPDIVYEDVATGDLAKGTDAVRAFAKKFLEGTPGVKVEPTSILIGPASAAVEWTMSAGTGEEAWQVRGAAILEHADGRITRATDYWNAE